jgi:hypothetical protein
MKTTFLKISLSILLLALMGAGCEKEDKYVPPSDPAKAILGKWELIEMGNWPDMEPVERTAGYIEYLQDGTLKDYNFKTGELEYVKKYWIDTLLHESIRREDGFLLTFEYRYQFYDDKLRLDYSNLCAIFNTFIYKRKK